MTPSQLAYYEATLAGLKRRSRMRELSPSKGVDFTSNDYLGIANSPRLKAAISAGIEEGLPVGAGGSRLLRGNHVQHELLEEEAAAFFGSEKVIYFSNGFSANVAIFSCLPQREDIVVHDTLIHASVHDGMAASKAEIVAVRHNDVGAFDEAIRRWRVFGGKGRPWIAVESVYSMDGDIAPVAELADLANRHGGFLVVDEAHATGVLGQGGRGLAHGLQHADNVLALHTCGKALGTAGALLGLHSTLAAFLINRARNFIYSTAPSPLLALAVRESLRMIIEEPDRRERLEALLAFAREKLQSRLGVSPSRSQIMPVMIGDNGRALRIATRMRAAGFDIRAIRPPTVPEGTARLRISITRNVDEAEIEAMVDHLAMVVMEEKP